MNLTNGSLTPYLLAIGSNLCFASASIVFTRFARSHSPTWINQLKVVVGFLGFLTTFLLVENFVKQNPAGLSFLLTSGFVGLFIGDFFLFRAFTQLGPSRTLVLFSFQPLILGLYGYLFLEQEINKYQLIAIGCMIVCLVIFVTEKNKLTGRWHILGFAGALMGVLLDSIGIMCTRSAYEFDPSLGSFQANATRALGAMVGFLLLKPSSYGALARDIGVMHWKMRTLVLAGCFFGTFVSLSLYLAAIKTAHVATLTAITITLPIWAGLIEHIRDRKWPNYYLSVAFFWFVIGFAAMLRGLGL